jgi:glycosyltransferase involved in cell wall biosynthesis
MKIAFLIRSLNYGGAERQLTTLAKGFYKEGHSVVVAVFYSGGPLEEDLRNSGVKVHLLNKRNRWDVVEFFGHLVSFLKKEKPDILHSYLVEPNILTGLLKPFFPAIKMVWGIRASNMDLSQYDWFSRLTFRFQSILSKFPDLIIANSNTGRDYHLKYGFPRKKMVVIYNGIDTTVFHYEEGIRREMRQKLGIKEDEKLIGLIGRLDPMKDHSTFIKAAGLLKKEREDVRFICVGRDVANRKKDLQALSQEIGLKNSIIWLDEMENITGIYNALDINTSSSSYGEGFSNTIAEAMACGTPCVVSDVGDSSLIVGDTGIVVPPKDPEALKEGLKVMLNRLEREYLLIRENTRNRIISQFSCDTLIQKTSNILLDLIKSQK